jgi:hypothetical protein
MKNIPERIYLQIGEDCEADDFSDLSEVTWAEDWINENDILYVKPLSSDAVLAEVRAIEIAFDELSKYIDFHKTKNSLCNDNFHKVNLYHTIKDGLKKLSEHFS